LSYSYNRKDVKTALNKKSVTGYYMCVHSRVKDVKCKGRVTCRITYAADGTENKNINITNPHNGLCVPNLNDPIVIDGFIDIKAKMKQLVEKKYIYKNYY
jgi:hypothetical protein